MSASGATSPTTVHVESSMLPPSGRSIQCGTFCFAESIMRLRHLTIAAAALLISTQASAQEWVEYTNVQDRFTVNLPAQPTIRDFTYTSWLDAKLPARVYTVSRGAER